jgi:hypothetical protein
MPGGTRAQLGNELFEQVLYLPTVPYPTLAANASSTNTLTVPGVLPLDVITFNMQAPPAHIFLENAYISAPNTVVITWTTDSAGISSGTMAVLITVDRAENAARGISGSPATLT